MASCLEFGIMIWPVVRGIGMSRRVEHRKLNRDTRFLFRKFICLVPIHVAMMFDFHIGQRYKLAPVRTALNQCHLTVKDLWVLKVGRERSRST